jgi:transposase-like protein
MRPEATSMARKRFTDAQVDSIMAQAFAAIKSGAKVHIELSPCPKCGATDRYTNTGTPNWQNRWTCPKCGRHESR